MSDSALVPAGAPPSAPAMYRQDARMPAPGPSPIEKAAIILMAVGPELGGAVLRDLSEPDLIRFARTLSSLGRVKQEVLDAVVIEFLALLTSGPELAGGDKAARKLLGSILDEAEVARLLGETGGKKRGVWDRLNDTPFGTLATFIAAEHPQTATLILSELRAETAAAVLERLDKPFAQAIVLRLSRVPSLDGHIIQAIQGAIDRDFLSALQRNLSKRRPADLIAGLMNNISSEARDGFLGYLEEQEPALAQDVLRTMFTFEDVATRVNGRDISAILRAVPDEVLLPALKLGQAQDSATVGFVLGNVPRRLAERYVEDVANMPDVSRKDGEAAQIEITKVIQAMVRRGEIRLMDKEG